MEDVTYLKDELLTVSNRNCLFDISYWQTRSSLRDIEDFVAFVKGCVNTVRRSVEYKAFLAQQAERGLTRCQILGHVESDGDDGVDIEMHHGPILTLFDYCAIVIDHMLNHNELVDTFKVARTVLNEHWEGNVQVVFLSKTAHELVDSGELFINFNQCTGNINAFLKKYIDGITPDRAEKINRYIDMCEQFDTFDNGLFDLKKTMTDWNYEVAMERMKEGHI